MEGLQEAFPKLTLSVSDDYGIPSGAKEAVLVAVLADATLHGWPSNVPAATGAKERVVLGDITPGAGVLRKRMSRGAGQPEKLGTAHTDPCSPRPHRFCPHFSPTTPDSPPPHPSRRLRSRPRKAALVVAVEQEPASLDPRVGSDVAADRAFRLFTVPSSRWDRDFQPVPDLVESWSQPSPSRYVFRLKRGIRFSDGRPLTARDVAYTLDSIRTGIVASFKKGDLDRIASVSAASEEELVITLREPFAPILSALNVGIVPEGSRPGDPLAGTGPYRLKSWVRGSGSCSSGIPTPRCRPPAQA